MAVSTSLDIEIGSFQSNIKQAQSILKGLNAEMKAVDAEFKATGNSEKQLADKTKTLNSQLRVQKGIADQARQALKAMDDAGVKPTDADYQKLYATMMNATAGANEAQAALNQLGAGAAQAADGAEQLTKGLNGISRKISLDQVISGIDKITSGLERAAKKAVDLGKELWNTIMDSASRADDTATMAEMYGIDLDTFMRMQKIVAGGMDTSVEAILKSQSKLRNGLGEESKAVSEAFKTLGINTKEYQKVAGQSGQALVTKDNVELFWEAGQALMKMRDESKQEALAMDLFGRSWRELVPLFDTFKSYEEYQKALDSQTVNTEETIRDLAALNDAVGKLEDSWKTLKDQLIGAIAPALTDAAGAVSGLLNELTKYLKTDAGQELLTKLGTAVSDMLSGLKDISAEELVNNFSSLLSSLTKGLKWIKDNGNLVAGIIGTLGAAFAGLTITGNVLTFLKLIQGIKDFKIFGNSGAPQSPGDGTVPPVTGPTGPTFWDKIAQHTNGFFLNNGAAVMDWMTHEGPLGPVFQGFETLGEWVDRMNREQQERTDTFLDNWNPNSADANVLAKAGGSVANGFAGWLAGVLDSLSGQPVKVEPEVEEGAANSIAEQVGEVKVPAQLVFGGSGAGGGGGGGMVDLLSEFMRPRLYANGIHSVPYDGMLARLHKGERVVPAREVSSRNFSSNLYVENMNMNGGLSADALAASIASRNRRVMAGYGS